MSDALTDPATLDGDALAQWYRRSPADIEQARQAAFTQRYNDFFKGTTAADSDADFDQPLPPSTANSDPSQDIDPPKGDPDPGLGIVQISENRWRTVPMPSADGIQIPGPQSAMPDGDFRDRDGTGLTADYPGDGGDSPSNGTPRVPGVWVVVPQDQDNGATPPAPSQPAPPPAPVPPAPATGPSATSPPSPPPSAGQQVRRSDPQRTDVFQPGPDGKLHPIPSWHTTGPFDFGAWSHNIDWGGVANDLGTIAGGSMDGLAAASWARDLIGTVGPKVASAIEIGLKEAIEKHHALPKFMGGRADQELVDLYRNLHRKFHGNLADALGEAGFPRVGGKGGGTLDWGRHFDKNPGSYDKAIGVLRQVTRDFDEAHGTSISPYLERELQSGLSKPPPPRN